MYELNAAKPDARALTSSRPRWCSGFGGQQEDGHTHIIWNSLLYGVVYGQWAS